MYRKLFYGHIPIDSASFHSSIDIAIKPHFLVTSSIPPTADFCLLSSRRNLHAKNYFVQKKNYATILQNMKYIRN